MIRILIVEDSVTQREILRQLLDAEPEISIVGEARDGCQALAMVQELKPDVVLMDIHMPILDGVQATRQIMSKAPVPIVIISATLQKKDIDHGMAALEAGAVALVQKPTGAVLLNLKKIGPELREAILAASQANLQNARRSARRNIAAQTVATEEKFPPVEIVGICTSTGGPPVLNEILSRLPQPIHVPILLVQHISQGFEEGFAKWLSQQTGQPIEVVYNARRLTPGIWMSTQGKHLSVASTARMMLTQPSPSDIHCPSGNQLFSSLAHHFGPRAAGVQLTGMGDDGAKGLLALRRAGGQTLVQDEASSLIYGMPQVAMQLGAAVYQMDPREIAAKLTSILTPR